MMHTEIETPLFTAHRAAFALLAWVILSIAVSVAWAFILPVMGVISLNLVIASSGIIALGMGIVALSWYWAEA